MYSRPLRALAGIAFVAPAFAACSASTSVETSPYPVSASAVAERNELIVPDDLEIRSATYSVTALSEVGGAHGSTSRTQVRPLITLFATRRTTGEQLILIYEDLAQRKEPSQIIRVVPGAASAR